MRGGGQDRVLALVQVVQNEFARVGRGTERTQQLVGARAQGLQGLQSDLALFDRWRGQQDADRVADALVEEDGEGRRWDRRRRSRDR